MKLNPAWVRAQAEVFYCAWREHPLTETVTYYYGKAGGEAWSTCKCRLIRMRITRRMARSAEPQK